jgi:hypothetical protein
MTAGVWFRVVLIGFVIAAGAISWQPADAGANITREGCIKAHEGGKCHRPFVFFGKAKADPVNLVFVGGSQIALDGPECTDTSARSPECVEVEFQTFWRKRARMGPRLCDAGADLTFWGHSNPKATHSGEANKSLTTSRTCKRQYHVRIWGDQYHGHAIDKRHWAVGAIHHEDRCPVPAPHLGPLNPCPHGIDMNWETAENVASKEFATSSEGEGGLCKRNDYYPLAGSDPPGKEKHSYKTGFPTRISFQGTHQQGCRGG